MSDFVISCCSTADLGSEYLDSREVKQLLFQIRMEGKQYMDDGESLATDDLYRNMAEGSTIKTSQPQIGDYVECWESILESGKEVVHLSISSGVSGAYRAACSARDIVALDYPAEKIHIVDTLSVSAGYGMLVDYAAHLRDEGKSATEVASWLETNKLFAQQWFFTTDLTCYFKSGLIKKGAILFGNMFNTCPIFDINDKGVVMPRTKSHGPKNAINSLVRHMEEHAVCGPDYSGRCYITHSACEGYARQAADKIEARFKNLEGDVVINPVGLGTGSFTGACTLMVAFMGDRRIG